MTSLVPSDLTETQKAVVATIAGLPRTHQSNRVLFEKVLFLLAKSVPEELPDLEESFHPYKFGPYSEFVDEQILQLGDLGLLKDTALAPAGRELAAMLTREPSFLPIASALARVLDAIEGFSVDDVLFLVYRLYPDFTTESEIRDRVRSPVLAHFSVDLDRVSEGQSMTVTSDKGISLNVRRKGGKLELTPVG
jgi:hypothetical protein